MFANTGVCSLVNIVDGDSEPCGKWTTEECNYLT